MNSKPPRTLHARKLLVAAVGIASVNYVAIACDDSPTSGNLVGRTGESSSSSGSSGDSGPAVPPTSGNLPSPAIPKPSCEEQALEAGTDAQGCPK